jgi:hypothetical protein
MILKQLSSGHLAEVLDITVLIDPFQSVVPVRIAYGEELADPEQISKADLGFPSGEPLPRCWTDEHYRDAELTR